MTRFTATDTPLADVFLLERRKLADDRGFLERLYCDQDLRPILGDRKVRQVNRTLTRQPGVVRGLHFQRPPHAELKIVTCLRGSVFDVAVDLRAGSPTFLQWTSAILSEDGETSLVIPEGVAHGFQTLSESCELLYLHTHPYAREAEGGLNAADPRIGIRWPREITERSQRDLGLPLVGPLFEGLKP